MDFHMKSISVITKAVIAVMYKHFKQHPNDANITIYLLGIMVSQCTLYNVM